MNVIQITEYIKNNLNDLSNVKYQMLCTNTISYIVVRKNETVPHICISYYVDYFKLWMNNTDVCYIINKEMIKEYNSSTENKFQLQLILAQTELFAIELHFGLKSFLPLNF